MEKSAIDDDERKGEIRKQKVCPALTSLVTDAAFAPAGRAATPPRPPPADADPRGAEPNQS
jgi:hypothetical protein